MTGRIKPGFELLGFTVARSTTITAHFDEDQVGLTWRLLPAMGEPEAPWKFVVLGDLTLRTDDAFAGVQAACYLGLDDRPEALAESDWELANELLRQYGEFVAPPLYDFAALAMRSQLAGTYVTQHIPHSMPEATLVFADGPPEEPVQG